MVFNLVWSIGMISPSRIIDLHTHLFNARYVPLASIIAHAMKKDESRLANRAAALLEALAGSSYEPIDFLPKPSDPEAEEIYLLDEIWAIARHELIEPTEQETGAQTFHSETDLPGSATIMPLIVALSELDYAAEGWHGEVPPKLPQHASLTGAMSVNDVLGWARKVVCTSLKIVVKLMEPGIWGHAENYLEFFLTMLKPEQGLVNKIFEGYGEDIQHKLQVVHFMMDMQLAYKFHKSPRYAFHPTQHEKMQRLAEANKNRVAGFSAFDPRRSDWEERAKYALDHGFAGFKFYPAMGYLPADDPDHREAIEAFFDFCLRKENDAPVFVHCTPNGFQTKEKLGWNAHPKHWKKILDDPRWENLRLCFGHAGGGDDNNGANRSFGWMATNKTQWEHEDNFARIVVELCVTKPNVYCELGYITELFKGDAKPIFKANFARACQTKGKFSFLDKVAYGSDWHMPDMVDNIRKYLDFFVDLMNQEEYVGHIENFFWGNAVRYAPRLQFAAG